MKILISGPKGSGKSTIGKKLAEKIGIKYYDSDDLIIDLYYKEKNKKLSCREIFSTEGEKYFRELELKSVKILSEKDWCIVSTGGSTLLNWEARKLLLNNSIFVYLTAENEKLWFRASKNGLPAYLKSSQNPKEDFFKRVEIINEVLKPRADIVFDTTDDNIEKKVDDIKKLISEEIAIRMKSANTFGEIIRVTTFGESHGKAIGCVIDGIKPGIELSEDDIQKELNRRRPGQSLVSSPRKEEDKIEILSGIFEVKTTGTPICMLVYNKSQKSEDYEEIKDLFRPGHADWTFWKKYGIRDYRGGGRSSGRETVARVAAGAIAKKILESRNVKIYSYAYEIAGIKIKKIDFSEIEKNPVRAPDPEAAKLMQQAILNAKKENDSVGGIVETKIINLPAGIGDPVFGKLNARIASAILSIGAIKGIEFGNGFQCAKLKGSQNNDQMKDGKFLSNNAGGILGGISNGNEIVFRVAVKPTSSIGIEQDTIDIYGNNRKIKVKGRHDPCIVPRVIPVIEAMTALVILDAWEIQKRLKNIDF